MHVPIPTPLGPPDVPTHCPYAHPLGPDTGLAGWQPCACRWAMAPGWDGQPLRGHRVYYCLTCYGLSDERRTVSYWPPHEISTEEMERLGRA